MYTLVAFGLGQDRDTSSQHLVGRHRGAEPFVEGMKCPEKSTSGLVFPVRPAVSLTSEPEDMKCPEKLVIAKALAEDG